MVLEKNSLPDPIVVKPAQYPERSSENALPLVAVRVKMPNIQLIEWDEILRPKWSDSLTRCLCDLDNKGTAILIGLEADKIGAPITVPAVMRIFSDETKISQERFDL